MFGGGDQVAANVVLSSDNSQYDSSMQESASHTEQLLSAYERLQAKVTNTFASARRVSFGVAAADIASVTTMAAAYGHFQEEMRGLQAQSNVLNQTYGQGRARMTEYTRSVNEVRSSFGDTTREAARLVQTISGFQSAGSTRGLGSLADTFSKMSESTGENASALAQSVLSLSQAMGTGQSQVKGYTDQLTTMAAVSNTSATSLASFASQISPLGRQLNMTQSQVTGFAAAFSKAGQDGFRATNVFAQMTTQLAQGIQTNSPILQQYANLLGVSASRIKQMSGAQVAAGAFDKIAQNPGESLQILNNLGFDGPNAIRTISAVAQQSGGVQNMLKMSQDARGNGSHGDGQQTLGQQFSKLRADTAQSAEAIGKPFAAVLQKVMGFVDELAKETAAFMQGPGGKMIQTLAVIVGSFASLATAILQATHVLGPLITILTIKNLAVTQGFIGGLRGSGRIGPGGEGVVGRVPLSIQRGYDAGRRAPAGFFNLGQRFGAATRRGLAGPEEEIARSGGFFGGVVGPTARRAGRVVGGVGRFGMRYGVRPMVQGAFIPSAAERETFLGGAAMPAQGRFGRMRQRMLGVRTMGAAVAEGPATEAGVGPRPVPSVIAGGVGGAGEGPAGAAQKLSLRLEQLAMTVAETEAGTKAQAKATELLVKAHGGLEKAMDATIKKYGEDSAITTKVVNALAAMEKATTGAAAGVSAMSKAAVEQTAASEAVTTADLAQAEEKSAGMGAGLGMMGGGLMMPALMAITLGPMLIGGIKHMLGKDNKPDEPADPIRGTGLPFAAPGVVAPLPADKNANAFNPEHPSPQALYGAQQGDYQTDVFNHKKKPTADQVAALYGPQWNSMSDDQKRTIIGDAAKAYHGNVRPLLKLLDDHTYGSYGPKSAEAVYGMDGGLAALYANQSASNFANLRNPLGQNFQNVATDFFGTKQHAESYYGPHKGRFAALNAVPVAGPWANQFLNKGAFKSGNDLYNYNEAAGGFMGVNTHQQTTLTKQGKALADALGQDSRANGTFAKLVRDLPKSDITDKGKSLKDLLSGMNEDDLAAAMRAGGANESDITGNKATDLAHALSEFNAHSSKELVSAFKDFKGVTNDIASQITAQETNNPEYGAAMLTAHGATAKQMLNLQLSGIAPNTVAAWQASQAQRFNMLSPYMSNSQRLFGSEDGKANDSGMRAGMIHTPIGAISGQASLLGVAQWDFQAIKADQAKGNLSGQKADLEKYQSDMGNVISEYNSQVAAMKQYEMSLDSMKFSAQQFSQSMEWAAQQEKLSVSREKSDQSRNVHREEYSFHQQRKRAEADYARQRRWNEEAYHLQRSRAMADFAHQTTQMIKSAALSMHDIYSQDAAQGTTSAGFLLYNNSRQTANMQQQEAQLGQLRGMGLTTGAIQQLSLTDPNRSQETASLVAQILADPSLVAQFNQGAAQRTSAAGGLVTDKSSMSWAEQEYQFKVSMDRSAQDFATTMKHSKVEFDQQMTRSAHDFARQMHQQNADFQRQLSRQQADYNTSVSHSWTTFNQGVSQSMHQMNMAAGSLKDTMGDIGPLVKAFGSNSAIGKNATALQNSQPAINKLLTGLNNLLNPPKGSKQDSIVDFVTSLTTMLKTLFGGLGGRGGGGANPHAGAGLPPAIQKRMATDHPTAGYCLRDVADVLGAPHGAPTAYAAWRGAVGHRHRMGLLTPIGAPIFFGPEYGGGSGHVAINAGGGQMWSEDTGRWEKKGIWANPLGWSGTVNGKQVSSEFGMKGFAQGSWNLPADMIAQIHKGEMIIPAKTAHLVRQAVSQGQVANLRTASHAVVNHIDARSWSTTEQTTYTGPIINQGIQNPQEFADAMKQQARTKALAKR